MCAEMLISLQKAIHLSGGLTRQDVLFHLHNWWMSSFSWSSRRLWPSVFWGHLGGRASVYTPLPALCRVSSGCETPGESSGVVVGGRPPGEEIYLNILKDVQDVSDASRGEDTMLRVPLTNSPYRDARSSWCSLLAAKGVFPEKGVCYFLCMAGKRWKRKAANHQQHTLIRVDT